MIERIRLVNPARPGVMQARIKVMHGFLVARTEDCRNFSIYAWQQGKEFYCGRQFTREEIATWVSGELIPPDNRTELADELGDIPALAPNPKNWMWYFVGGRGEERLRQDYKPTIADLQRLAGLALQINLSTFYPLGDPYEIWVCDKDTEMPLFLAMTGSSLEEISSQFFSPLWRFNWSRCDEKTEIPLRKLQKLINNRVNLSERRGTIRWKHRLFERQLDGSSIEFGENLLPIAEHPAGWLPLGLLAEPYETIRRDLEPEY